MNLEKASLGQLYYLSRYTELRREALQELDKRTKGNN